MMGKPKPGEKATSSDDDLEGLAKLMLTVGKALDARSKAAVRAFAPPSPALVRACVIVLFGSMRSTVARISCVFVGRRRFVRYSLAVCG
jgi:hypothetical protein